MEACAEVMIEKTRLFPDDVLGFVTQLRACRVIELLLEIVEGKATDIGTEIAPSQRHFSGGLEHVGDEARVLIEITVVCICRGQCSFVGNGNQIFVTSLRTCKEPIGERYIRQP